MTFLDLQPGQSRMCTVEQLLTADFCIPSFQRPYDWERQQVHDLVCDLADAHKRNSSLFLGLMVVCPLGKNQFAIVDGQQRLTTLMLALASKDGVKQVLRPASGGLRAPWISPRTSDAGFVRALLSKAKENPNTLSQRRLLEALNHLDAQSGFSIDTLLRAQLIVYVAPSLSGATGLFERINLRGKDVSQFDLVKNKLIEWINAAGDLDAQQALTEFVTDRYDRLYRLLDPSSVSEPFNSDKLLKIHWILFSKKVFKTGQRVLANIEELLIELRDNQQDVGIWIQYYLNSLVEVAEVWIAVERPYELKPNEFFKEKLRNALLSFARLNREAEFQPLIVAAIVRWGTEATNLVKLCEIASFRSALAKYNSNSERSKKWRFAQKLYQKVWFDGKGNEISDSSAAAHQIFWATTPWWNAQESTELGRPMSNEELHTTIIPENALDSPKFRSEHGNIIHYLFWNYGVHLPRSDKWGGQVREDISPFQESVWFSEDGFRNWDVEHIYPQNPEDRDNKAGKAQVKLMESWLNHLGNITVLPIHDNRKMQNAAFDEKLNWLREQRKVSFNELLASADYRGNLMNRPHWGPNNCKKRVAQLKDAAGEIWGVNVVKRLGVGKHDTRLGEYVPEDDDADFSDEE